MNRRSLLPVLAGAALAATAATASASETNALMDLLSSSVKEKKGVTLYVKGQQIVMLVTKLTQEFAEGRNQQQSRIVVRIDQIDAVTMS